MTRDVDDDTTQPGGLSLRDTDPTELAPSDEWLSEVPPFDPIPGAPEWFNLGMQRQDQRLRDSEARTRRYVQRVYDRGFQNHAERLGKLESGQRRHSRRINALEYTRVTIPMLPGLIALVLATVALVR